MKPLENSTENAAGRLALAVALPLALLALLVLNPPHELDLAVSHLVYRGGRWLADTNGAFEVLTHDAPKFITLAIIVFLLSLLGLNAASTRRNGAEGSPRRALLAPGLARDLGWGIAAAIVSLVLVWWLKRTTGVACPWNVTAFGGNAVMTDPVLSLSKLAGNCWPAGHAGTGFSLFGAAIALWRTNQRAGRRAIGLVAAYGLFCGLARVAQGAHFVSHVLVTGLLDWLVALALFAVADACARLPGERPRFFPHAFSTARRVKMTIAQLLRPLNSTAAGVLFASFWWTVVFNRKFVETVAAGSASRTTLIGLACFSIAAALIGLLSFAARPAYKFILIILHLIGALAAAALTLYGTVMTPDMVRNFLATDTMEAAGYISPSSALLFLAYAVPPIAATLASRAPAKGFKPAMKRGALTLVAFALGLGCLLVDMQGFAGAMRADKTLRYQIAPVNVLWSTGVTFAADRSPDGERERVAVDPNARIELPTAASPARAPVLAVVVGETTRSANWSLSGYKRATAGPLAQRAGTAEFVNFPAVAACGTSTDVSLPCMLSRLGRSDYDRDRILSEEALPKFLLRSGARVLWFDNQSGCKGTCMGVPTEKLKCPSGACFDEELVGALKKVLASNNDSAPDATLRPTVVFLHMLGSHGPAYADRSPKAAKVWTPECRDADLSGCAQETVVNAYDNSVRYTASVLESAIAALDAASAAGRPTALLFMSDHGESLGEKGLYLHGAPYLLAPDEQTVVPGLLWISKSWQNAYGANPQAYRSNAAKATHEHLWSTVLGLLKIKSTTYRPEYDLGASPAK